MESLGCFLKKQREEKGYSLEAAQEETKIQIKYLRALEEENFSILPGEVFARGFLRSYADFLGISSQEVMEKYYQLQPEEEKIAITEGEEIVTKEENIFKQSNDVLKMNIKWPIIIATVGGLLIFVWLISSFLNSAPTKPQEQPVKEQTVQVPKASAPQVAPLPAPVYIKTIIKKSCWLRVSIDGKIVFEGVLAPETVKEWKGQKEVTLKLGNAGGVKVKYNNKDLGNLGAEGQVVDQVFTP